MNVALWTRSPKTPKMPISWWLLCPLFNRFSGAIEYIDHCAYKFSPKCLRKINLWIWILERTSHPYNGSILKCNYIKTAWTRMKSRLSNWTQFFDTISGHKIRTQIPDTHSGHNFWTQDLDTNSGHNFRTQFLDTISRYNFRTQFPVVG